MRPTPVRASFLLLSVLAAIPAFAAIDSEITLPVTGYLELSENLIYRTEVTITNHRDVQQYVRIDFIQGGRAELLRIFPIDPRETIFAADAFFAGGAGRVNRIGAMRIRAIKGFSDDDPEDTEADPLARIEANAFIVAERPVTRGSTRQEVEGIPASEYRAPQTVFLGVRHSQGTGSYTNVGITNLDPTRAETFLIEYQFHPTPMRVTVPPMTLVQVRVSGPSTSGRFVRVYPEWAAVDGQPSRTSPWVAYASTVDTHTGDAYSGMRVPPTSRFDF